MPLFSDSTQWITAPQTRDYIDWVRRHTDRIAEETGRSPAAFTHHYGCQQNVADGERIDGMLAAMGYSFCDSPENADFIIFNTCAVRENAENRIFGNVGALVHHKRRNPNLVIALSGCMMQQPHIAEKIKKSFPYVDIVLGTHALPRFPQLLHRRLSQGKRVFDCDDADGEIVEDLPLKREGTLRAWLPVMYGCDNFCTYCVVPLVRGRERSRRPERILAEARALVEQGYKEITLLGQNVNSYGKGLEESINFSEILRRICAIPGDFQLRFMTSHPKDCTRELIDTIAEQSKICSHIHLPVQCGSDRVLREMNRGYTAAQYLELIDYARRRIPDVSFTSDIIVGFPGETQADFEDTLRLVERVGYHSLFTFIYSKRENTRAAAMEDPVTHGEKTARFDRLLALQQRIGLCKHEQMVGKAVRVLTEGPGRTGDGMIAGRTQSNIIVEFPAPSEWIGRFVQVKITGARNWALLGEMIDGHSAAI